MPDDIELATPEEIAAQRSLWLIENPQRAEHGQGKLRTYTKERKEKLEKIAKDYQVSEKKRKAARPWVKQTKSVLQRAKEEDERFEKVFRERFEDPTYYGLQVRRRSKTE